MTCKIPIKDQKILDAINKDALHSKQSTKHVFRWMTVSLIFWLIFFYCCDKVITIICS
jgi:hypothetical protein